MVGLERGTVELVEYDPAWREHYEAEVERLRTIAGDRLLGFEHIGSTAIEGLAAKPIVDLLAFVEDLDAADALVPRLEAHGYEYRPDGDVRGRRFLAKGPRSARTHYLSLAPRDGEFAREKLAFRDYLRANPDVAAEYDALKRRLAAAHPEDRSAYTEAKGAFIRDVLDRALGDG